jgi:pimeloyl-ACP methyl ester carboxylesterase
MPFANNKGVRIHYEVEGAGPPLVMLHGFYGTMLDWYEYEYVEALKDDFQLILIDQRGHGISDKPHESEKYTAKLFADDVVAVLDELAIEEFNVYGFSMGAWFVFALAKYYPEKLISLIIADGVPIAGHKGEIQKSIESMDEWIAEWDEASTTVKDSFLANDRKAMLAIADARDREIEKVLEIVDEVTGFLNVPCLIFIRGVEQSDIHPKLIDISRNMARAELISFDGLKHFDVLAKSEITLPKIKDFLGTANRV